ncbi:phosphatidylserine decarboxylase family protein [Oceanidesulfovibrio indonesiensis]|uniref:Phosphatidylserine decarboxylase proenzyme n=1 Tax=Oceanidesulfovibrio indonesiensis TaxID=54767 RepID=A0A7M3MGM5_9BACT|nr:phosphatidylserine decarboxylase family protein [Oceanidesulfovibrio indonesiensis]TVM18257.1 phosphatidylserine decarboxylase family protein [Oceanidesulfovibrio indonesiensis]
MNKPSIGTSLEGLPYIFFFSLCSLAFGMLEWWIVTVIFLILTALALNFFRDPERVPPEDETLAVSPADGKVIKVATVTDPFSGEERTVVSIFMNIFNVHVNRMPAPGIVTRMRYHPGKFVNASFDKASEHNERHAIRVSGEHGEWTVVQIAGLVARRIVPWCQVGDSLARGERFGLIKFGSRVDVYLPADYQSIVSEGETVFAGQTAIAAPNKNSQP